MARRRVMNDEPATPAQKESFAAMLRERRPPAVHGTTSAYFAGRSVGDTFSDFPRLAKEHLIRKAEAQGISTSGKHYNGALVRREFTERGLLDPEAFVSDVDDIKRVVSSHPEWDCNGTINQVGREPQVDLPNSYSVADHLVEESLVSEFEDVASVNKAPVRLTAQEWGDAKEKKRSQFEGDKSESTNTLPDLFKGA